jgi:hypothetical protein
MSEEVLRIFLSDLTTIRITCQRCNTTIETNVADVGRRMKATFQKCPFCNSDFLISRAPGSPGANYDGFSALAETFAFLQSIKDQAAIEFPVKPG